MDETGRTERIVVRFDLYKHRRKLQWASPNRQCLCKRKDSSLADTLKIYQYPLELSLSRNTLDFAMSADSRTVIVTTSHQDYDDIPLLELKLPEDAKDWCTVEVDNQGILSVSVSENQTGIDRETELTVTASILERTLHIAQKAETKEYYRDGEYMQLQAATKGKGINIVIMGDGFLQTDLDKGGYYETLSRQAEHYFSILNHTNLSGNILTST